jgi:toxin-antitoxin system PIN domain toxin
MLIADVNVFVNAHRPESQHHQADRRWLEAVLSGIEPVGVSDQVLGSFVRIVTHRRIFTQPSTLAESLAFCSHVRSAPAAVRIAPGARHWEVFTELCTVASVRGNGVPDAYLAALAVEHGATWVTHDRGFARFPGLRWSLPEG